MNNPKSPFGKKQKIISYYDALERSKSRSKSRPKRTMKRLSTLSKKSISSKSQISLSNSKNSVFISKFNEVKNLVKEVEEEPPSFTKKPKKRFSYFGSNGSMGHNSRKKKLNQLKNMMKAELNKANKLKQSDYDSIQSGEKVEKLTYDIQTLLKKRSSEDKKKFNDEKENILNFESQEKIVKKKIPKKINIFNCKVENYSELKNEKKKNSLKKEEELFPELKDTPEKAFRPVFNHRKTFDDYQEKKGKKTKVQMKKILMKEKLHFFTDLESKETQKESLKKLQYDSRNLLKSGSNEDSLLFEIENDDINETLGCENSGESMDTKELDFGLKLCGNNSSTENDLEKSKEYNSDYRYFGEEKPVVKEIKKIDSEIKNSKKKINFNKRKKSGDKPKKLDLRSNFKSKRRRSKKDRRKSNGGLEGLWKKIEDIETTLCTKDQSKSNSGLKRVIQFQKKRNHQEIEFEVKQEKSLNDMRVADIEIHRLEEELGRQKENIFSTKMEENIFSTKVEEKNNLKIEKFEEKFEIDGFKEEAGEVKSCQIEVESDQENKELEYAEKEENIVDEYDYNEIPADLREISFRTEEIEKTQTKKKIEEEIEPEDSLEESKPNKSEKKPENTNNFNSKSTFKSGLGSASKTLIPMIKMEHISPCKTIGINFNDYLISSKKKLKIKSHEKNPQPEILNEIANDPYETLIKSGSKKEKKENKFNIFNNKEPVFLDFSSQKKEVPVPHKFESLREEEIGLDQNEQDSGGKNISEIEEKSIIVVEKMNEKKIENKNPVSEEKNNFFGDIEKELLDELNDSMWENMKQVRKKKSEKKTEEISNVMEMLKEIGNFEKYEKIENFEEEEKEQESPKFFEERRETVKELTEKTEENNIDEIENSELLDSSQSLENSSQSEEEEFPISDQSSHSSSKTKTFLKTLDVSNIQDQGNRSFKDTFSCKTIDFSKTSGLGDVIKAIRDIENSVNFISSYFFYRLLEQSKFI